MSSIETSNFRIQELAAGFSLGDLTEAESLEINSFAPKIFQAMAERSEESAARAFLTYQGAFPNEPLPAALSSRLKSMANGFIAESKSSNGENVANVANVANFATVAPSSMGVRELVAWLSMAASIALAMCIWLPGKSNMRVSMVKQRDSLIASASDIIRSKWESTKQGQPIGTELGEVVWSTASQQGFMTIQGLPINDVTIEQYQLWIIDPTRDDKPVDGGVFDISSTGESIIPIRAKLRVDKPTVFAITVEKPGGVVVSDQKRLPLIAKIAVN